MTSHVNVRATSQAVYDDGLRSFMTSVFNRMGAGLLVSAIAAALVSGMPTLSHFFLSGPMLWVTMLSPLAFVLVLSFGIDKLSVGAARGIWWAYCTVMGISMSTILLAFTGASVALTFFVAAAMFSGMALYGYTTKADLSRFGSFLLMGLFGLVIAMVVNLFLASSALHFAISAIGVLLFTGLAAYDVQMLKDMYHNSWIANDESRGKLEVFGALTLYLDFVNLFQFLLQFLGVRTGD